MPLTINCGLSRKASKDFQSTGVSINVTAELDQSLLARPDDLQREVAKLYSQAEQALDRQAGGQDRPYAPASRRAAGNGHASVGPRNGHGNGRVTGSSMTESQRKAIMAIARRAEVDPAYEAEQIIGTALDDLTVRQASELIDHLKGITPANSR